MSKNLSARSPNLSAMAKASHTPSMETPSTMLLQILAAWPAPASPAWITALAMGDSACSTRLKHALLAADHEGKRCRPPPPAMPPDTGASAKAKPEASAWAPTSRALSTSMVEQSISRAPGRASGSTLSANTWRTCWPAGSMVMTTSASLTASAALSAVVQPAWRARSSAKAAEVEGMDIMAGPGLIGGHAGAHVAEPDEGDTRHASLPDAPALRPAASIPRLRAGARRWRRAPVR